MQCRVITLDTTSTTYTFYKSGSHRPAKVVACGSRRPAVGGNNRMEVVGGWVGGRTMRSCATVDRFYQPLILTIARTIATDVQLVFIGIFAIDNCCWSLQYAIASDHCYLPLLLTYYYCRNRGGEVCVGTKNPEKATGMERLIVLSSSIAAAVGRSCFFHSDSWSICSSYTTIVTGNA